MKLKKIAAAVLAAAVLAATPATGALLSPLSVTANAEDILTEGDYSYTVNEDGETVTIDEYNGTETEVVIPGTLGGKTVTTIRAFRGCPSLSSVTIPDGVTTMNSWTFRGYTSLESISVEENNQSYSSVNGVLFNKDKSELICYPAGKNDKSYTIPDGVTTIGNLAFSGCTSLTSVTIPDSVTTIGYHAFEGCTSLTSVKIPDSVTTIGDWAFSDCTTLASVTIPDSVTTIGDCAFRGCTTLASVTIPDSVTTIGEDAFYNCTTLASVTIPNSVTTIGKNAFSNCTSLENIIVGENNAYYLSINGVLFNKDKSKLIYYPAGMKNISYTIPDGVTAIGDSAFQGCTSLSSVTIPDGVTAIGSSAFQGCTSLSSVTIPDGVTAIGSSAFSNCTSLLSVTIPNGVTAIETFAFSNCTSLTSVTIPDSVTTIDWDAFSGCTSLTSVTIPDSVTTIGSSAFRGCTSLESISVEKNNQSYSSANGVLFNKDMSELICYPAGKNDKSYTIPNGVTTIEYGAFYDCASLTSITIPDSLDCNDLHYITTLTEIKIDPESTEYLSENGILFNKDKTKLISYPRGKTDKYYTVPSGVTNIGNNAMYGNDYLVSVILPDGVETIGYESFVCCCNLKWVFIPESVTTLDRYAFIEQPQKSVARSGYTLITDIYYGGSEESWEKIGGNDCYYKNITTIHYNCVPVNVTDKTTEINITGIFSANVELSVKSTEDLTNNTQYAYELAFTKADGLEAQPESEILIKVPIPESFKDKTCYVYVQNVDGKNVPVDFTVEDDMIVFSAENIKNFTISGKKLLEETDTSDEPETSDPTSSGTSEPATSDTSEPTVEIVDEDTGVKTEVSTEDKELDGAEFEANPADYPTLWDLIKKIIEKAVDAIESVTEEAQKSLEEAAEAVKNGKGFAYDMGFKKNGKEVQPDKSVTVTVPVPDKFKKDIDKLNVYHLTNRGAVYVPSWIKDSSIMFRTNSFSPYVITTDKLEYAVADENTTVTPGDIDTANSGGNESGSDQKSTGITLAIAPVVLAAGVAVVVLSKKKK